MKGKESMECSSSSQICVVLICEKLLWLWREVGHTIATDILYLLGKEDSLLEDILKQALLLKVFEQNKLNWVFKKKS